jgi:hypothetical protein
MDQELKDAIIKNIQIHKNDFQLVNNTKDCFSQYIYDAHGEYLIGGEKVAQFINEFIKLYTNENI